MNQDTITDILQGAKAENRGAFIAYYPAGFPTVEESITNLKSLVDAGVDLIEVGLPFSDPMMDGPTIQAAANVALDNGFRVRDFFDVVHEVTSYGGNCVFMTYYNLVLQYGPEKFAKDFAKAGGLGAIIPDLIPEEAGEWIAACEKYGIDPIFLVAPSSTAERLKITTAASRGFVYVTSHMGVTGARESIGSSAGELVERVREISDIPACVGLGVKTGKQAAELSQFADGIIVGSVLITAAEKGPEKLDQLANELAAGVRGQF
ncbi:tryptophan synthase subunit alpha [Corynebacterium ulceribovis]|uniref:tryptophan synthase subunit alpha n=1 Tax=Corynebacterium ulceribovis TaxID=487732 RepID=UPI0003615881|nr:tryptophan synthase subunit alpha [Corynebacterium ulceribovis]